MVAVGFRETVCQTDAKPCGCSADKGKYGEHYGFKKIRSCSNEMFIDC